MQVFAVVGSCGACWCGDTSETCWISDTLIILAGDLNSRTIMPSGQDILTETLRDRKFCQAILYKIL